VFCCDRDYRTQGHFGEHSGAVPTAFAAPVMAKKETVRVRIMKSLRIVINLLCWLVVRVLLLFAFKSAETAVK
jgi:hypothetical protein